MAKPLVIVESPAKARTLERFLGNRYAVMASVGHIRDLPESAKEIPAGDQGQALGPDGRGRRWRLQAVLRRPGRQEGERPETEGRAQGRLGSPAGDRPGPGRRVHQLAPQRSPEAAHSGQANRVPRDHRGSGHRGHRKRPSDQREPGSRAGIPPDRRPALRVFAVAGTLEEGADGPERGTRAERRRPADRRARGSAARVPHQRLLGSRGAADAAKAASSRRRSSGSAMRAWRPERTSTRRPAR